MARKKVCMDGNAAAAHVAHATNEVIAIYPITPSSPMGEISDAKSAADTPNIWGTIPSVVEMQSEGGASGAVHGALTSGALTTTFTASQGLLLMIPNMFKIAGELTSTVFHVSARSIACQALSIFGDHSDVMATRSTGFAQLCSGSVQEVMDFALISQAATLESRIPFIHFFDGFRTSHEIKKVEVLDYDDMKAMINDDLVLAHRNRGLTPDRPVLRGSSQNPDVYFQGRETVNKYYEATPAIVQKAMDNFAKIVGREYKLFDYIGHPEAERVVVMMGSGADAMHETIDYLVAKGEKVGMIKVRLFRPFSIKDMIDAFPKTVKSIATLDRTKEPGSIGEPLYEDVRTAIGETMEVDKSKFNVWPTIVGGRYALGSKEFSASMCKAVLDNLKADKPKNHFTVGINDDVTNTSIEVDNSFHAEDESTYSAMFYGLGSDGTVGANKNSIKIIGDNTDNYAQGYFVYDSKKAGAVTVSHLRFGKNIIRSSYLITKADFLACHNSSFLEKYDMLKNIKEGGTFLLNSMFNADELWATLPAEVQKQIIDKKLKVYTIDGLKIAGEIGLGSRINVIMQTAFFNISKVIDEKLAIEKIKEAIKKTYGSKGEKIVSMNCEAVDKALNGIEEVEIPDSPTSSTHIHAAVPETAPKFIKDLTGQIIEGKGDDVPVSVMPDDGSFPTGTTKYEKRNIAVEIPVWDNNVCIQCGLCSFVCPHAAIRIKAYDPDCLNDAPETFKSVDAKGGPALKGKKFTVQIAPEDCTGCGACIEICPAKNKEIEGKKAINMELQAPLRVNEVKNYDFFLNIPDPPASIMNRATVKGSQFSRALFEYSGACAGCGETPYVKLMTQLFGDRMLVANATGCSSIYGGNLPTTPYTTRDDGRGPAWSNSLFEDNAEFGLGMRLTVDKFTEFANELVDKCLASDKCTDIQPLLSEIKDADQSTQDLIEAQRARIAELKEKISGNDCKICKQLASVADYLVKKSVWIVGGDGWAYDIGYGGLDHALASGRNINVLVLDTEVYSNTGGQMSKATPLAAVAKFAAGGKPLPKKDLGMMAMTYGNVYVAKIAMGANPAQTVKAFVEAEAHEGPSLIIAYSHCIAHGINMTKGMNQQKKAVASGSWPLYRFNPALAAEGKNPLTFESKDPSLPYEEYAYSENRFRTLKAKNPEHAAVLMEHAEVAVKNHFSLYKKLASLKTDE
ncbi:MAG: pyruvate:ferredoxin (flavodoxin) oxidoreductase [Chlamydiae bacterium]|nr:MAG: pyruvate:ferredoxin (flavodoxin) oxidoreductase [Chlamydiota bacterium]